MVSLPRLKKRSRSRIGSPVGGVCSPYIAEFGWRRMFPFCKALDTVQDGVPNGERIGRRIALWELIHMFFSEDVAGSARAPIRLPLFVSMQQRRMASS